MNILLTLHSIPYEVILHWTSPAYGHPTVCPTIPHVIILASHPTSSHYMTLLAYHPTQCLLSYSYSHMIIPYHLRYDHPIQHPTWGHPDVSPHIWSSYSTTPHVAIPYHPTYGGHPTLSLHMRSSNTTIHVVILPYHPICGHPTTPYILILPTIPHVIILYHHTCMIILPHHPTYGVPILSHMLSSYPTIPHRVILSYHSTYGHPTLPLHIWSSHTTPHIVLLPYLSLYLAQSPKASTPHQNFVYERNYVRVHEKSCSIMINNKPCICPQILVPKSGNAFLCQLLQVI